MTWAPTPGPQLDAISAPFVTEMLYGGARGGGKSTFLLADFLADGKLGEPWRGIIIRRTYPELEEIIFLSQQMVPTCWPGSEWHAQEKTWHLPTKATLRMRSLERTEDATKYQGHSYTHVAFDELTSWPNDGAYRIMLATLRSGQDVPNKRVRASANPGGPGHHWVKRRFIDPAPRGYELTTDPDTRMPRMFIPAKLQDNPYLMRNDPGYIDRLRGVGSPELVRAWLEGDWTVVIGSYFPEFSVGEHVWKPFEIPRDWLRFRALDWGSARPTCCLWCAVSDGTLPWLRPGVMVVYREVYTSHEPNVGMRLTVEQTAEIIHHAEYGDQKPQYSVADPAIFAQDGGPSIGERFAEQKLFFLPADNKRLSKTGAAAGWDLVRQRLIGEDGTSMLAIFSTCTNLIRTLPALQADIVRPEDVDTNGEDHAADALRYACASRPWVRAIVRERKEVNLQMLFELREQRMG